MIGSESLANAPGPIDDPERSAYALLGGVVVLLWVLALVFAL